jgi:hypothetical protein
MVYPNQTLYNVCNNQGTCVTFTNSTPPTCDCRSPYAGKTCTDCMAGYANFSDLASDTLDCVTCPALKNGENAGAFSGGSQLSACYYKGVCAATGTTTSICNACSNGWSGANCCDWTSESSPWILISVVTTIVAVVLLVLFKVTGMHTKLVIIFVVPTLQVFLFLELRLSITSDYQVELKFA